MIPVILAGGSGTRLWPLSRTSYPKQFVSLLGDVSLFTTTVRRGQQISPARPIIVGNEEHRFLIAEQLRISGIEDAPILLEPEGRNTAPAIALAALAATDLATGPEPDDPLLLVSPSDHLIGDPAAFASAIEQGIALANEGKLVTFGIEPSRPETGYGYIHRASGDGFEIAAFVEKPDQHTAEQFLAAGDYLWNSGIFLFRASTYLNELNQWSPDIHRHSVDAWKGHQPDGVFRRPDAECFLACPGDSIDYALMEKSANVAVIPMSCDWSDLGSWDSIWDVSERTADNNAIQGDVTAVDTTNCYLRSEGRLLTTLGCQNLIVVDTGDTVLVADKNRTQEIKKLVDELRADTRPEVDTHARVYRPWGDYEGIDHGDRYQVKRIVVRPGAKLSLQKHHHRAEHWVVVRGTAIVTRGEEQALLTENQSTYIPLGETHRLENPGSIPLELIEVQSGSYLGEDDIVRFDDVYGRDT
ncbi:MAG: mannose-1-phosphate guanylyltransferase/mannose-6-phosphate isomerase [Granulosicoccus sp.]|nr:mannose-1-phosphate guanylyltransferase/mannose-6-phosphate isomerase [Granulosicoccus sp.]